MQEHQQEEVDEEEVLKKCKVEEAKKGAHKGRGEQQEWRIVKRAKEMSASNMGVKTVGQESTHGSGNTAYNEAKGCKTEEEQMKQQQRMPDMIRMIEAKGSMDASNGWRVSNCWLLVAEKRGFIQNGRIQCRDGTIGCMR